MAPSILTELPLTPPLPYLSLTAHGVRQVIDTLSYYHNI